MGVNVFVGVGNGLRAALPHTSPRLKILIAPHWCCRVNPRAGYPGSRYPRKTHVLEIPGVKVQDGSWWGPKRRLRVEKKVDPRDAYPRGLKLGRDSVMMIAIVSPFTPG